MSNSLIILYQPVVTEDGLTAETGYAIKFLLWNRHIINPTSYHDELPLRRQKKLFLKNKYPTILICAPSSICLSAYHTNSSHIFNRRSVFSYRLLVLIHQVPTTFGGYSKKPGFNINYKKFIIKKPNSHTHS